MNLLSIYLKTHPPSYRYYRKFLTWLRSRIFTLIYINLPYIQDQSTLHDDEKSISRNVAKRKYTGSKPR